MQYNCNTLYLERATHTGHQYHSQMGIEQQPRTISATHWWVKCNTQGGKVHYTSRIAVIDRPNALIDRRLSWNKEESCCHCRHSENSIVGPLPQLNVLKHATHCRRNRLDKKPTRVSRCHRRSHLHTKPPQLLPLIVKKLCTHLHHTRPMKKGTKMLIEGYLRCSHLRRLIDR